MESPSVTVGRHGLRLGTEAPDLPLLAGAMHYFRVHKRHWGRCLDAVAELGLSLVESYVPWVVHEREPGELDFTDGPQTPSGFERDLGGFLDACAERGLRVILRPGPHINAELTGFGFPDRILADRRCQAVGSRGNPVVLPVPPRAFPVPSYASETFLHEAGSWLKGFGDFVAPWCWPDGPLVAVQLDNELSLFFRTGAYDQDYHPDALALYRRFLEERYPDHQAERCEPPRRFDPGSDGGLTRHLDWIAFKERMLLRALERLGRALKMTGLDRVVLFHNFIAQRWGASCSLAEVEQSPVLDLAGLDIYLGRRDYAAVKHHALALSGASRLPFVPELGCGSWPWWFPYTPDDQQNVTLSLLMHGVKGFNLYMAVERDRWYGSPVSSEGQRRRGRFDQIRRLVQGTGPLLKLHRQVEVGVLVVRDYERLCLCSALTDPFPPVLLDLFGVGTEEVTPVEPPPGLDRNVAAEYGQVLRKSAGTLDRLQVPYHYVDSELPANRLASYKLLLVPSFELMDQALLVRLGAYVEGGGRLVLWPEAPRLDRTMEPLSTSVPEHVASEGEEPLESIIEAEVERLGLSSEIRTPGVPIDLAVYREGDRPAVLFVANPTDEPQEGALEGLSPGVGAVDALAGQPVDLSRLHLEPFEVRMLSLKSQGDDA